MMKKLVESRTGLVGAVLVSLLVPAAWAHGRPYAHHHRHAAAVIVVGKPRPVQNVVIVNGRPHGALDFNVKPKSTQVWVDGTFRGNADALDVYPDKLYLPAGPHRIKLVTLFP